MEHVDYPHEPGTLYDCDACESECHGDTVGDACVCSLCTWYATVVAGDAIES